MSSTYFKFSAQAISDVGSVAAISDHWLSNRTIIVNHYRFRRAGTGDILMHSWECLGFPPSCWQSRLCYCVCPTADTLSHACRNIHSMQHCTDGLTSQKSTNTRLFGLFFLRGGPIESRKLVFCYIHPLDTYLNISMDISSALEALHAFCSIFWAPYVIVWLGKVWKTVGRKSPAFYGAEDYRTETHMLFSWFW